MADLPLHPRRLDDSGKVRPTAIFSSLPNRATMIYGGIMSAWDIFTLIWTTAGYFGSVFFLLAASVPSLVASLVALGVTFMALLVLDWLRRIGMNKEGAPMGCLLLGPIIIFSWGLGAWVARLLGWLG